MLDLSIVITTYNRLELLKQAVQSVRLHRLPTWELIVVDDASVDATPDWLAGLEDPWITTIKLQENSKESAARNAGLARARGDLIHFLDDDDLITPGLRLMERDLRRHADAVAAIGRHVRFDEAGNRRKSHRPMWPYTGTIWPSILLGWGISGGEMLFRRDAVIAAGSWKEDLDVGEDIELFLRVALRGPVVVRTTVMLERRVHANQTSKVQHDTGTYYETRRKSKESFVQELPLDERDRGERCLEAWKLRRDARMRYRQGDPRRALQGHLAAIGKTPRTFFTPLHAMHSIRDVASSLAGTILGSRRFKMVSRWRAAVRTRLRRDPGERVARSMHHGG